MYIVSQQIITLIAAYAAMRIHNKLKNKTGHQEWAAKTLLYLLILYWIPCIALLALDGITNYVLAPDLRIISLLPQAPFLFLVYIVAATYLLPLLVTVVLPAKWGDTLERCFSNAFLYYIAGLGAMFMAKALHNKLSGIGTSITGMADYFTTVGGYGKYGAVLLVVLLSVPVLFIIIQKVQFPEWLVSWYKKVSGCLCGASMRERINAYAADERSYLKRLGMVTPIVFSIAFTCFLFGPVDIYFSNVNQFGFVFKDFIYMFLIITAMVTAILSAALALLRGRFFDVALYLALGITICLYIQGTYMNIDFGSLDGTAIDWATYNGHAVLNTFIWLVGIAGIVILCLKVGAVSKMLIFLLPVLIVAVQAAAGIFSIINAPATAFTAEGVQSYELSADEQLVVSKGKNVIVLVLDYFSNQYIDDIVAEYPDALDSLKDFTYYSNADTTYFGTFPSINHILTGHGVDTSIGIDDWFEESWESETASEFYRLLEENEYEAYIYTQDMYIGSSQNAYGKIANVELINNKEYIVNRRKLITQFSNVSLFRYVPFIAKPLFWTDTDSELISYVTNEIEIAKVQNNYGFYNNLLNERLCAVDGANRYIFIHLRGTHPTYSTDENCQYGEGVSLAQNGKGCFVLVDEYLNQLRELGVYDNSAIIITSDHGDWTNTQPIYFIKRMGEHKDSMEINTAPISEDDHLATVLDLIGIENYSDLGSSVFDIAPSQTRERTVWIRAHDAGYPEVPKYGSNTSFAAENVYYAYTYIGDNDDLLDRMQQEPTEIIPMTEGF